MDMENEFIISSYYYDGHGSHDPIIYDINLPFFGSNVALVIDTFLWHEKQATTKKYSENQQRL